MNIFLPLLVTMSLSYKWTNIILLAQTRKYIEYNASIISIIDESIRKNKYIYDVKYAQTNIINVLFDYADIKILEYLLDKLPELMNNDNTIFDFYDMGILFYVSQYPNKFSCDIIKLLITKGIDYNIVDHNNNTFAHVLFSRCDITLDFIKFIMRYININAKNNTNNTPFYNLIHYKCNKIMNKNYSVTDLEEIIDYCIYNGVSILPDEKYPYGFIELLSINLYNENQFMSFITEVNERVMSLICAKDECDVLIKLEKYFNINYNKYTKWVNRGGTYTNCNAVIIKLCKNGSMNILLYLLKNNKINFNTLIAHKYYSYLVHPLFMITLWTNHRNGINKENIVDNLQYLIDLTDFTLINNPWDIIKNISDMKCDNVSIFKIMSKTNLSFDNITPDSLSTFVHLFATHKLKYIMEIFSKINNKVAYMKHICKNTHTLFRIFNNDDNSSYDIETYDYFIIYIINNMKGENQYDKYYQSTLQVLCKSGKCNVRIINKLYKSGLTYDFHYDYYNSLYYSIKSESYEIADYLIQKFEMDISCMKNIQEHKFIKIHNYISNNHCNYYAKNIKKFNSVFYHNKVNSRNDHYCNKEDENINDYEDEYSEYDYLYDKYD